MLSGLSEKNFKVIVRVRPLTSKQKQQIDVYEQAQGKKLRSSTGGRNMKLSPSAYSFYAKYHNFPVNQVLAISKAQNTIYMADPQYKNVDRKMKAYSYSNVYATQDHNQHIFKENMETDVGKVLSGYNCTILAYGITGSGKTYTIFGKDSLINNNSPINSNKKHAFHNMGISYQALDYLFQERARIIRQSDCDIKKCQFKFSFIEIYNENVRDLLVNNESNKNLNIVEDAKGNTSVSDITEIYVNDIKEVNSYITLGTSKRAFSSTQANQYSSRSHAIIQLHVDIEKGSGQRITAKLFIIDLAGSQKILSLNSSKKILQGANINKSLLALGNCITTLSQNSRKNTISHIPYRDSKLTRMLKDSLGGNTKTIMIACISSNPFLIEQTTTTLNYALRAQGINKKIVRNTDLQNDEQFICMKCKKNSSQEHQTNQYDDNLMIDSGAGEICQDLLQQVYEDIIDNAREAEKIRSYSTQLDCDPKQCQKLQQINEKQRIGLKKVLQTLFTYKNAERSAAKIKPLEDKQNKQNWGLQSREDNQMGARKLTQPRSHNLSGSKSRRRRSHNKFQMPRRAQSAVNE